MLPKPEIMSTPYMSGEIDMSANTSKCKEFKSNVISGVVSGVLTAIVTTVLGGLPIPIPLDEDENY